MLVEFSPEYRPESKGQYRLKNGQIVPGCSTIAGVDKPCGPLMSWAVKLAKTGKDFKAKTEEASSGGNVGHFLIECFLKGNQPSFVLSPPAEQEYEAGKFAFDKFQILWHEQDLTYVHSELEIVSERYGYGGKLDIIARDKYSALVLVDIKTSKAIYGSHLYQLSGYENLYNGEYFDQINRRSIFRTGRNEKKLDSEVRWVSKDDIEQYFAVFLSQLAVLNAKNALKARGKLT